MKSEVQLFRKYWPLILLLLIIFLLRIASLFEPNRYADEDIYLTLGQGVRKGLVLYRDIHDNKPPFLYYVAALAGNIFWFKLMLLATHAVGVVFFYKLAELVFRKKSWLVFFSTAIFALLSTLPRLEGNIANGENFMIVPAIIGTYLLYGAVVKPKRFDKLWIYPMVGLMFSVGFLFKVPIVFDFVGIVLFWWLDANQGFSLKKVLGKLISTKIWSIVVGFIFPILIFLVYYSFRGAFEPFFRSALLQNIGYLSSWGGESGGFLENPLVWRGFIVLIVGGLVFVFRKRLSVASRFVIIWTAFSLYGALLSSRPYPHYLLEPLVPVSLLLALMIYNFIQKRFVAVVLAIGMFVLIYLAYEQIGFWYYDTIPYFKNFVEYASGSKKWDEYLDFWGARRNYQVAEYIAERTEPVEQIFVWGTEPAIYALSDRLPVGRYTVAYHIEDFKAHDETMIALRAVNPRYIVMVDGAHEFAELNDFIASEYVLETEINGASIYLKQ